MAKRVPWLPCRNSCGNTPLIVGMMMWYCALCGENKSFNQSRLILKPIIKVLSQSRSHSFLFIRFLAAVEEGEYHSEPTMVTKMMMTMKEEIKTLRALNFSTLVSITPSACLCLEQSTSHVVSPIIENSLCSWYRVDIFTPSSCLIGCTL